MTAPNPAPTNVRPMTIDTISADVRDQPNRLLVIGTEGVGKTTFATCVRQGDAFVPREGVIMLCAEDGLPRGLAVPRFPEPRNLGEVFAALETLRTGQHGYTTLVVDTVDWLEPLIWAEVCRRNNWATIESPGYGKGYIPATAEWRKILNVCDDLRHTRGMEIILLAHAALRTVANPAGEDYSRWECKLQRSAAAVVVEWCDDVLFANHETLVRSPEGGGRTKGVSTGQRLLFTEHDASHVAKSRNNLPPVLALDWATYVNAREGNAPVDLSGVRLLIGQAVATLLQRGAMAQDKADEITGWANKNEDAPALDGVLERLNGKIASLDEDKDAA